MPHIFLYLIIPIYFLLLYVVSLLASRKSDNNTFFRGNHKSPWYLVAFGMIGASVSGVSFVSVPGYVRSIDMTYLQMCIGFFFGYIVVAYLLLPIYYKLHLTSIYSYLGQRLGRRSHFTGAAFFMLSKLTGAAARLYLICLILQEFLFDDLGIPYTITVIATLLLVWLYTRRSGIRALVFTDTLQTFCMLAALLGIILVLMQEMNLDLAGVVQTVKDSDYGRIFVFDDWFSKQNFWKQFLSGVFIVIVMTGLDQDMMQKNLTCHNLKSAQKDMMTYGFCFIPINLLFLVLGVLLYTFINQHQMIAPVNSDELLPMLISKGYLGSTITILFILGIVSAAFSSVDSAITALTTTFCIDILKIEDKERSMQKKEHTRKIVHLAMTLIFVLCILTFKALNSTSVIDAIYIMASYTYGPLLGFFCFGLFTKRQTNDYYTPYIAIASPFICYGLNEIIALLTGYHFGYELLMLNGILTFVGLLLFSYIHLPIKEKR